MRNKLPKHIQLIRNNLSKYRKYYDDLKSYWIPGAMFTHAANFSSKVINTDNIGLRFNKKKNKKSIFDFKKKNNSILVGSSLVFGVGASSDETTISSLLSVKDKIYYNTGVRAYNGFQEIILFLSYFSRIKVKIKNIIILSGHNDCSLHMNKSIDNSFPGPFYWKNIYSKTMNDKAHYNSILKIFNFNRINDKNHINTQLTLEDILSNNLFIWKMIQDSTKIKIYFILQPYLNWAKKASNKEKNINKLNTIKSRNDYLLLNKKYKKIKNIYSNICKKNNINFIDSNEFIKKNYTIKDTLFIDNVHLNDEGNLAISKLIKKKVK